MIVYKKVRVLKDGNYYPLFIDKCKKFTFGQWMKCSFHPTKGFAPRSIGVDENGNEIGGWHSCPKPEADWIADMLASGERRVWMKCEAKEIKEYERPQGIWYLSKWIKPLEILNEKQIKNILEKGE